MAGIHPYVRLLDAGGGVTIGGRSSDCAIFVALTCDRVPSMKPLVTGPV